MKKLVSLVLVCFGFLLANENQVINPKQQTKVEMKTYGYINGTYSSYQNDINLYARSVADFSIKNSGFSFGLGAIGRLRIPVENITAVNAVNWDNFSGYEPWPISKSLYNEIFALTSSSGDISDAYISYIYEKDKHALKASLGRFNSDFVDFDWIYGNIQGLGVKYDNNKFVRFYGMYVHSHLNTGYNKNLIGSYQGTSFSRLIPYSSLASYLVANSSSDGLRLNAKNNFIGGDVFMLGAGIKPLKNLNIDVFALMNSTLPGVVSTSLRHRDSTRDNINNTWVGGVYQFGGKADFALQINEELKSISTARFIFQQGNIDEYTYRNLREQNTTFLIWLDENVKILDKIHIGAGFHYTGGREGTGGIWSLNNPSRYYGDSFGNASMLGAMLKTGLTNISSSGLENLGLAMNYVAPYFQNNFAVGYLYGGLELDNLRIDTMLSFFDYQEISLVAKYRIWAQHNLELNVGGGYIFARYDILSRYNGNPIYSYNYKVLLPSGAENSVTKDLFFASNLFLYVGLNY